MAVKGSSLQQGQGLPLLEGAAAPQVLGDPASYLSAGHVCLLETIQQGSSEPENKTKQQQQNTHTKC